MVPQPPLSYRLTRQDFCAGPATIAPRMAAGIQGQQGKREKNVTITVSRNTAGQAGAGAPRAAAGVGLQADWAPRGHCVAQDPDALFVRGAAQQDAKLVCQRCPVIAECLADALDNRTEFGVWGGKTERERRAMLRTHPNVASWWSLFHTAAVDQASRLQQVS